MRDKGRFKLVERGRVLEHQAQSMGEAFVVNSICREFVGSEAVQRLKSESTRKKYLRRVIPNSDRLSTVFSHLSTVSGGAQHVTWPI
jgi:hypothetical protein